MTQYLFHVTLSSFNTIAPSTGKIEDTNMMEEMGYGYSNPQNPNFKLISPNSFDVGGHDDAL